jgi:hypothetical protein
MVRQKHELLYIERTCFNIISSCRIMCFALIIHDRGIKFVKSVSTGYNVAVLYYGDDMCLMVKYTLLSSVYTLDNQASRMYNGRCLFTP